MVLNLDCLELRHTARTVLVNGSKSYLDESFEKQKLPCLSVSAIYLLKIAVKALNDIVNYYESVAFMLIFNKI